MYEFMCGGVPFGEAAEDPMDVYLAVINEYTYFLTYRSISFPQFVKDKDFKQLMILMLGKNPLTRMFKLSQIKLNIWFKDFNWENLIGLNAEPAKIPAVSPIKIGKSLTPYVTFSQVKLFIYFSSRIIKNGNQRNHSRKIPNC